MKVRFADEQLSPEHIELFTLLRDKQINQLMDFIGNHIELCKKYIDDDQRTLLHSVCEIQNYDLIKRTLQIVDNKNPVDEMNTTPLLVAVACASSEQPTLGEEDNDYKIIKLLIENGCDLTISNKRKLNVYHHAASRGRLDLIQLFVSKWKQGMSQKDKFGNTPLHRAVVSGNIECVKFIGKKTYSLLSQNAMKKTPLHVACEEQNMEMIKTLIDLGADADMKDEEEKYPFQFIENREDFKKICEYYKQVNSKK